MKTAIGTRTLFDETTDGGFVFLILLVLKRSYSHKAAQLVLP